MTQTLNEIFDDVIDLFDEDGHAQSENKEVNKRLISIFKEMNKDDILSSAEDLFEKWDDNSMMAFCQYISSLQQKLEPSNESTSGIETFIDHVARLDNELQHIQKNENVLALTM